jgi:lipopolysaccharide export system protein LptA
MVIESRTLELDDELKRVTFTGDVDARQENLVIKCDKMVVFYESQPLENDTQNVESKIKEIVATGSVKINRDQGGIATAQKAVYFQKDDKLVLTGKPMVKQKNDFVEGERITVFLKENRTIVESGSKKKVRAMIFKKSKKE